MNTSQPDWTGVGPASAWHLIDRYADSWEEAGRLMDSYVEYRPQGLCKRYQKIMKKANRISAQEIENEAQHQRGIQHSTLWVY